MNIYQLTIQAMTKKPRYCPNCGKPIWGEGWNSDIGSRYFSHVDSNAATYCYESIELQGTFEHSHPLRRKATARRIKANSIRETPHEDK